MFMLYFIMGALFTYVAFQRAEDTIWEPLTIILLLVAALDFLIAFRMLIMSRKKKKK